MFIYLAPKRLLSSAPDVRLRKENKKGHPTEPIQGLVNVTRLFLLCLIIAGGRSSQNMWEKRENPTRTGHALPQTLNHRHPQQGTWVFPHHEQPLCPTGSGQQLRWVSVSPVVKYFLNITSGQPWHQTPTSHIAQVGSRDINKSQRSWMQGWNSIALGEYFWKTHVKRAWSTQATYFFLCSLGTEQALRWSVPGPLTEAVPAIKDFTV